MLFTERFHLISKETPPLASTLLEAETIRLLCLVPSFVSSLTGPHSSGESMNDKCSHLLLLSRCCGFLRRTEKAEQSVYTAII